MERMVVLAKSIKNGNYCLAGKLLDEDGYVGEWVRPIADGIAGSVPMEQTLCGDGHPAEILDVVAIQWGTAQPQLHQRENRLLGTSQWVRCGYLGWSDLPVIADEAPTALWLDGFSTYCGRNDRVPASRLHEAKSSLYLVAVQNLVLYRASAFDGKIKRRARFGIGRQRYDLALTDSVAWSWVANAQSTEFKVPEAYVCISLATPFVDGFAYKVAAAIITPERVGELQ
jgi:hypothetical protein